MVTLIFCMFCVHPRYVFFFFFQAEDGIRDWSVTGVQTCALPISLNVCRVVRFATPNPRWHLRCTARSNCANCDAIPAFATILVRRASCTCTKTAANSNTQRNRPDGSELGAWMLKSGRHGNALRSNLCSSTRLAG